MTHLGGLVVKVTTPRTGRDGFEPWVWRWVHKWLSCQALGIIESGIAEVHYAIPDPNPRAAGGHQRLLEIAMGLGQHPKLLILDEPTQGLAASEISGFISLIREVSETSTVLLIEHNMDVVMELAHQITVLDMGKIIAEGTPSAIRENAAVQAAYLGG